MKEVMGGPGAKRSMLIHVPMVITILCILVILYTGVVDPYRRGFYCNDERIRKPYKPNTISVGLLLSICLIIPFLVVNVVEITLNSVRNRKSTNGKDFSWNSALQAGVKIYIDYVFGFLIVIALMHVGKSAFGNLRPHFIDVCKPNMSAIDCKKLSYIEDFQCTSQDWMRIKTARESFPSGHSAVAIYSLIFLLIYCFKRNLHRNQPILSAILLFIYSIWAVGVCVSRIFDYWHHFEDVLGGCAIGSVICLILFLRKDSKIV